MIDFGNLFGIAGAGASILGGFNSASGAIAAGNAQARAYTDNALSAGTTAANTWRSLALEQRQSDYLYTRTLGQQGANYGAAGVGPGGSPLDVMGDSETQYKLAALARFYQGKEAATQADQQATYDTDAAAAAAKEAAKINSNSDILGGIGSAFLGLGKLFTSPGSSAAAAALAL